jgi:hypothetical protein
MAKRASATKKSKNDKPEARELNPGVHATNRWTIYRANAPTLAVNADQLDITENGTLIFFLGNSNEPPQAVIAGTEYTYCEKSNSR